MAYEHPVGNPANPDCSTCRGRRIKVARSGRAVLLCAKCDGGALHVTGQAR